MIELSDDEMLMAIIVAGRRRIDSMRKNLTPATPVNATWDQEIEGAMAEMAFAKGLNRYLCPDVGLYGEPDVSGVHVRSTDIESGCLIIRKKDTEGRYALLVGKAGRYRIAGHIMSEAAKTMTEFLKNPNGQGEAFFIPQEKLDTRRT